MRFAGRARSSFPCSTTRRPAGGDGKWGNSIAVLIALFVVVVVRLLRSFVCFSPAARRGAFRISHVPLSFVVWRTCLLVILNSAIALKPPHAAPLASARQRPAPAPGKPGRGCSKYSKKNSCGYEWRNTPPAVGPWCRRNLVSCGYGRDQSKLWLTDPNPKPTPDWLSGAMRRSRAITKKRTI